MIRFINEDGNKELKNRVFPLSNGIKKHLINTLNSYNGDKTIDGYKRLNNLISMKNGIKYNEMKRLKNFFDNYTGSPKSMEFILNGGEPMKVWIYNTLNTATTAIKDFKQAKKEVGFSNAFIKHHEKDRQTKKKNKPTQVKFKTKDIGHKIDNDSILKYENKHHKIICITEKQAQIIKNNINEAQSDNFSFEQLSSINSFKDRYNYCLKAIGYPCGKGSSRVVFQLTDDKILKLACNKKGIAQNQAEDDDYLTISPKVFDRDMDYKWIVSEYVLPAKPQDFDECLGLSFDKFCDFIESCFYYRFKKYNNENNIMTEDEFISLLENNEDLLEFDDYIGNYNPPMGDLLRLANYGMTMRSNTPTIVLLDAGLTEEIYNNHYS